MSVVVSDSMDEAELSFISEHAASKHGLDVASFLLESALERIEDELDAEAYREAMEESRKDPVTYTMEEAMEMLDV